jgi:NitT/TauT family transport system ATP-binding protein
VQPAIEVRSVAKHFPAQGNESATIAVAEISFSVSPGEVVCIVGRTGCGKSTLVNMLLGLETPTSGTIKVDGVSPSEDFMGLRRHIAAVFQTDRLLPWRTVLDNAALGLEAAGVAKIERQAAALPWLERVGLAGRLDAYPHQLSGGMRQRVAICRAFVLDPTVILLDEAFGHLDEVTAEQLRNECLGLLSETHKAAIVVTHNIGEALDIAHRILVLDRPARVLRDLPIATLRRQPDWEARRAALRDEIFRVIDQGEAAA